MSRAPLNRRNGTATPIHIVDGWDRGPDGQRLTPFARFAERIIAGGTLDDDVRRLTDGGQFVADVGGAQSVLLADGRIIVAHDDGRPPYIVEPDGKVITLVPVEVGPVEVGP